MRVISSQETVNRSCSCGVTLQASVDDIDENMHSGGYGFTCPKCGLYHRVEFSSLPKSMQAELGRREVGH